MKQTANRKSKVNLLPEDIRQALNVFIRSGDMTQKDIRAEINKMIDEAGLPEDAKLSRTGFNRYAKRMEDMGQKIKEAREVAEVWAAKLGEAPTSELGKLLQDAVRTLSFETSMSMLESGKPTDPKALNQLALVSARIEQAAMTSQKVEKEIRAAFAAEAAEKAEKIVKQAGITAATAQDIKNQILGIA
ncbi:DUF3486 family protein [Vibrio fluvialis]|uniref:DUF3486 family protein n=1 Tax=Vibrio fluvialis TaxID=676 RepID=UPI001C9C9EB3|nr:DUF3486 family protein [Vibrio fluvialis]MBY8218913.1 DUF3486 family protein [Vibrio fluvialis]MCG6346716.1 DUF3486 family protein [Vibrio fluvialis]